MKILHFVFVICFVPLCISAQEKVSKKVLFVGNSYTYFWNLPQNVHLMSKDQGHNLITSQSTAGGSNWSHHLKEERDLKSIQKIKEGNFDIVVIQNHSMSAIERVDSFMINGHKLAKLIRASGAMPMLYMTWSREWDPFMIDKISEKYIQLGKEINAPVVPVGLAFSLAKELRPDLQLYSSDMSHQSSLGTYLASCVFYSMLTGESSLGISNRLVTTDANGEKLYINIQSKEDAIFCQKVSDKIMNDFLD